MMIVTIEHF